MPDEAQKVVILGGGLTGISTAVHLRTPWVLFEKEARLGGHARTDQRDGYRFDKTGHWLHLRDPEIKRLVAELLPGQMETVARRSRIFSHGVLTRYPFQANLHGLPPDVIKECLVGMIDARIADARRAGLAERGGVVPGVLADGVAATMDPHGRRARGRRAPSSGRKPGRHFRRPRHGRNHHPPARGC